MLQRIAIALNVLVILTGFWFVWHGIYPAAGFSLFGGGLNITMMRKTDEPRVSFLPIIFNFFLFTVGNLGIFYGAAHIIHGPTETLNPEYGRILVWLCPAYTVAGLVSMIFFFRQLLIARRTSS